MIKKSFIVFFYSGTFKIFLTACAVGALVIITTLRSRTIIQHNINEEILLEEILLEEYPNISDFDQLFISCADTILDWKLLAAIAYVESKFDTSSVSRVGASGLMQVMPATYKQMLQRLGVEDTNAVSVKLNVMAAVEYIQVLDETFSFINPTERINYILGSYNGGYGRVFDAMRIAKKQGVNRYKWNNIETIMLTMNQEHIYTDSVCRFGKFDGRETTNYVKRVNKKYSEYLKIDSLFKLAQVQNSEMKNNI